ncbi:MAG TPA: hypothetical protein VIM15_02645 [Gemmatimonadaceae bacterium]
MQNLLYDQTSRAPRLRNQRGFAAMAVLMLSLGVGATTAVFSIVDYAMPPASPYATCETMMEVPGEQSGDTIEVLPSREELRDRVSNAYETSYESAGDAIGALPEMASGFGERSVLELLGAAAVALLVACTRGASRRITSPRASLMAAATTVGALAFATLSLRALGLPAIGVRAATFALCISVLAVYFARAAQRKAAVLAI